MLLRVRCATVHGSASDAPENPKDLHLHRFLLSLTVLPKPPEVIDNTVYVKQPWSMYLNDRYGCCVFASSSHRRVTQGAMTGQQITIPDDEVLRAYSAVTGFDPNNSNTDNGAIMVDAANWERHNALGGRLGMCGTLLTDRTASRVRGAGMLSGVRSRVLTSARL